VYRRALQAGLSKGRSLQVLAAASVYFACRKNGMARTFSEVVQVTQRTRKEISKCYRVILIKLEEVTLPIAPSQYVSRIVNDLQLSDTVERCALQITRIAQKLKLTQGKRPLSVATAAIYIARANVEAKERSPLVWISQK
jgi:transcription initiation factor TFIIB